MASTEQSTTSRAVWKFSMPFPPKRDSFEIELPAGAVPLAAHIQYGEPQLWALVDPDAPKTARTFRIAGTGHPITDNVSYVGTFMVANGSLVFHVFEVL